MQIKCSVSLGVQSGLREYRGGAPDSTLGRHGTKRKFSGDLRDKQKLAKYQGGR